MTDTVDQDHDDAVRNARDLHDQAVEDYRAAVDRLHPGTVSTPAETALLDRLRGQRDVARDRLDQLTNTPGGGLPPPGA